MRMWWLHFGQTLRLRSSSARYNTASQAEHLIHRPSGTERVRRSVLMREGIIFSNQDMFDAGSLAESAGDHSGLPAITRIAGGSNPGRPNSAGYRTAARYRPSGGAVAALVLRSREASTAATRSGGDSPCPTASSRPATLRTM